MPHIPGTMYVVYDREWPVKVCDSIAECAEFIGCSRQRASSLTQPWYHKLFDGPHKQKDGTSYRWLIQRVPPDELCDTI